MTQNRDILVMFRKAALSQHDIDRELMQLNNLLFEAERLNNFVQAHEVIDLNKYKIYKSSVDIKKMLRQKKLTQPFVFLNNKN
jgi:hypothetical protein